MRAMVAVVSLAGFLGACEQTTAPSTADPTEPSARVTAAKGKPGASADWREIASSEDSSRLGRLHQAWRMGRAEAEDRGFADQVEALGPLVDPNAGQIGRLQPEPGVWRCRPIKLGSNGPGAPGYLEDQFIRCTIELAPGGELILTTASPTQTRGRLYPDTDRRLVYIGVKAVGGEETGWPAYGETPERDQIGIFERVGSQRWRLVLPWPNSDSKLEILELIR